ncbi:MAG: hypothetical protein H7321_10015, partial [Bacteroidia bacterium]|nr:hypothetical protein [Bacteroidia bacterium]
MKSFSIKNYSKIFICAIAAFIGVQANAQDLVKHIPHNSIIVVGYNPASLIQKGGQLGKDVIAKTFTKRYPGSDSAYDHCSNMFFQKLMSDPSAAGINGNTDQYVFRQNAPLVETEVDKIVDYQYGYHSNNTDPKPAWVFLFSINDPEKFLNATRNCAGAITKDVSFERNTIKGFVNRNFLVAVNGNTGMIFKTDESYFYYTHSQDTLFDKEQMEEFVNADSIFMVQLLKNPEGSLDSAEKQAFDINNNTSEKNFELRKVAAMNAFYESFYNGMKTRAIALLEVTAPSLASNEIFNSGRNERHDAWFWVNTSYTDNIDNLNMIMRLWGGRRHSSNPVSVNPADPYTPVYIQDNYYMSFLNFYKGKAEMTFKSVLNPNLAKLVKKTYKAKQDKALFKYIDGSSLLGYVSTAVDLKAVGDAYEKIYLDYFNAMYHSDPSSEFAGTIAGAAEI